jgi:beta-galactosidase GanA
VAAGRSHHDLEHHAAAGRRPVLTADDYGFHQGDVWYRGRFDAGSLDTITLTYGGGGAGLLQVWLDGNYLGQHTVPSGQPTPETVATAGFEVPPELQGGEHVLSVMVRNNGNNQDIPADDMFKEGRGLISAELGGSSLSPVAWRIQGTAGGEQILDPVRGVMNAGGSFGERHGWHLPGYPDADWTKAEVPADDAEPGAAWYRTSFDLDLPAGHDVSLGLTIGDPDATSPGRYRALVFLNGWNLGQYIADVGPQHTFVLPNGILNPNGTNTLALMVTSDGGRGNGLERIALTTLGAVRGGVPVTVEPAPAWSAEVYGEPVE